MALIKFIYYTLLIATVPVLGYFFVIDMDHLYQSWKANRTLKKHGLEPKKWKQWKD
jgi:hypothetical protein